MPKKKKTKEMLEPEQIISSVQNATDVADMQDSPASEVEIETDVEEVETKTEVEEVEIDPKRAILLEFVELYKTSCKGHSVVPIEVAKKIWVLANAYSGRTDRFNGCSTCSVSRFSYLKKMCKENNIELC